MQYLFNKIYLSLDNAYESATNCVLISNSVDNLPRGEFEMQVLETDLGPILARGASYDDVTSSVGCEQAFFDLLADFPADRKLIIYANAEAYVTILAKWYKSLLTQLDEQTAYTVLHLALTRVAHTMGYPYATNKRVSASDAAQYRALVHHLPARSSFVSWWDSLTPYDLSARGYQTFADACGIEFLIASFFADPTTPTTPALRKRVQSLAHTWLIEWAFDWFEYALGQPSILPGFDIHKQTVDEWTKQHPEYEMITDVAFSPRNVEYVLKTYEPSAILDVILQIMRWAGYDANPEFTVQGLIDVREVVLENVLAYEIAHPIHSTTIATGRRSNLVNTYLLNRLYIEHRAGKTELASRLTLIEK